MGQRIAIVTDSTADFPAGVAEKLGIRVVPVHVVIDGVGYLDGASLTSGQLVDRMKQGAEVQTRAAAPAVYADLFESLLARYDRVLSFQVSSQLSDCCESAGNALFLLAPGDAERVDVFDTGAVSIGQAMYVLMALRFLKKKGRIAGMKEALDARLAASVNLVTVEDLSWLRRNGTVGGLSSLFGKVLDLKPLLTLTGGALTLVGQARGLDRALNELVARARRVKGGNMAPWEVWVCHCDAQESAFYLRNRLADALAMEARAIHLVEAGVSVAVRVGPGSCGWGMVPLEGR